MSLDGKLFPLAKEAIAVVRTCSYAEHPSAHRCPGEGTKPSQPAFQHFRNTLHSSTQDMICSHEALNQDLEPGTRDPTSGLHRFRACMLRRSSKSNAETFGQVELVCTPSSHF